MSIKYFGSYQGQEVIRGKIISVSGSWSSGLATMQLQVGKKLVTVHGDNGVLIRALDAQYGCITEGHTFSNDAIKGKEIIVLLESWGTISGWKPIEDCSDEDLENLGLLKARSEGKLKIRRYRN